VELVGFSIATYAGSHLDTCRNKEMLDTAKRRISKQSKHSSEERPVRQTQTMFLATDGLVEM
jgi:hypothetical protein